MSKRVRRILLVCNNYDSFALEEDGRIDVQIAQEYLELNLSNPPAITRAETTTEAHSIIEDAKAQNESFDLIILVYSAGGNEVWEFAAETKQALPDCPIVLLSSFSKEVYHRIEKQDKSAIDYLFNWNNSTDLIIAIIKLIEDRLNAENDILQEGVRAILLVEDSVRYYSTYLPLLYKLVLQQNTMAIRDALNEKQQLLRKRARPKVLMATCYDEAVELYRRFGSNMIGVISDIGFVRHKGEPASAEQLDAGIELCRLIREENPTMPFLMQSSQESMRQMANKLKVGFVIKQSKTLTQEVSEYIESEFGFGDFIARDPKTGREIDRASDLEGFERIISTISPTAFRRLSDNNYLSKWLFARGLFTIGRAVSALQIHDDMDIPLGRIRIRKGGGSAGHNGIKSLIEEIGSEGFHRMRIGVGHAESRGDVIDYVLSEFSEEERTVFDRVLGGAAEAAILILRRGIAMAMNQFNPRDWSADEDSQPNKTTTETSVNNK